MDRQLLFIIAILAFASVAAAETRIDFHRRGSRVEATVYLNTSPAVVDHLIADVRGYDRLLPRFMRAHSLDATGRRLRMRIDLPWPCRDIEAIFARVEGGHGTERWQFVEGNIEDGNMVLIARPHGRGTLVTCTLDVELPGCYPDWLLGAVSKQVLEHVVREIERQSI
jgi:hypothetical protein